MARDVTGAQLLASLRQNMDLVNDTHVTDAELYRHLSEAVGETWDAIISAGLGEQFVKSETFSSVPNQTEYPAETICTDGDFYKVSNLYVVESSGRLRSLPRINPAEIEVYKPPTHVSSLKLYYIPCAPVISTGAEVLNGFNGWEGHILACAEIGVRKKRDEDTSVAYRRKLEIEQRIERMANTDWAEPARVVRKRTGRRIIDCSNSTITAYGIRGGNIELYEYDVYGVVR
jgi:hypothetical protein